MLFASAAIAALATASPALAQDADPAPPPPPPADSTPPPAPPADAAPPVEEPVDAPPVVEPINGTETPAKPLTGTINPFYGTLNPFHGTINPFYGPIDPFTGTINPFYGTLNPFYGDIGAFWGTLNPFYGPIDPFTGNIIAFTGNIIAFNSAPAPSAQGKYWEDFGTHWRSTESLWTNPLGALQLKLKMDEMILRTELAWGSAIKTQTNKSFRDAFLNPLFARYGINPADARTLQALSADRRAQFFLDWYDSLMTYAGIDRVDWWMAAVNWTPSVTQQQGSGSDSIIGLLDA